MTSASQWRIAVWIPAYYNAWDLVEADTEERFPAYPCCVVHWLRSSHLGVWRCAEQRVFVALGGDMLAPSMRRLQRKTHELLAAVTGTQELEHILRRRQRCRMAMVILEWGPGAQPVQICVKVSELSKVLPPFVMVAAWRTVMNGWCTARRYGREVCLCMFCGRTAFDDVCHISHISQRENVIMIAREACPGMWSRLQGDWETAVFILARPAMRVHEVAMMAVPRCAIGDA